MKRILVSGLAGAALLALPLCATRIASSPPAGQSSVFADRAVPAQGGYFHTGVLQQVKQDVEQIRTSRSARGNDSFRLNNSVAGLNEFQSKLDQHVYDDTALQRTIDALARVASFNRMPEHDRKMLKQDIQRLRVYRRNHADWYYEHAPQES